MYFFSRNFYLTIIIIFLCILLFSTAPLNITPEDLEHIQYEPDQYQSTGPWSPNDDMTKCIAVMRKYCGRNASFPHPTAWDCLRQAVLTWDVDTIPEGILKKYYLSFTEKENSLRSISSLIMSPEDYCNFNRGATEKAKCEDDLKDFKDTAEDAVNFALYSTKISNYCEVVEVSDHTTSQTNTFFMPFQLNFYSGEVETGTSSTGNPIRIVRPTNINCFNYMLSIKNAIKANHDFTQDPHGYCQDICFENQIRGVPLDITPYLP